MGIKFGYKDFKQRFSTRSEGFSLDSGDLELVAMVETGRDYREGYGQQTESITKRNYNYC